MNITIREFKGRYRFLSNFWYASVRYEGVCYSSVEHAYQAAKTTDSAEREHVRDAPTAAAAKRAGRYVRLRRDWGAIRLDVMRALLLSKFSDNADLARKLLDTGDAELVEGNDWGDVFWGKCRGMGENHLGRLLMEVRSVLCQGRGL